MSKTQLKKLLSSMTAGQIAEMVMDLYNARPEAKEYLDFFCNPDIESKLTKARAAIKKEMWRTSRGRNRMRFTRIRKTVKDIASLNPGPEPVAEIMTYAIEEMCRVGADQWIKDATQNAAAKHIIDTLKFLNNHLLLPGYLPRIQSAIDLMTPTGYYATQFHHHLRDTLATALESTLSF